MQKNIKFLIKACTKFEIFVEQIHFPPFSMLPKEQDFKTAYEKDKFISLTIKSLYY
jgi:hypothetical protein